MIKIPGATAWQRFNVFIATGFGIGLITPIAPGTVGSLPGVLLAWFMSTQNVPLQIITCIGLSLIAVPICHIAEQVLQKKDDGRICADEWMLFPICVIGIPLHSVPFLLPVFFLVTRFCDITKPPPARGLQRITGGIGIVIDDFFASLYALVFNHLIYFGYVYYFG
ncbi:MAG: phosphatidylglycerophosphatase A [Kiritimatiellae bacterium]|jgi:phosphatidylglycerophosphatase A|nr:phosphatidylglycerophosphatase A [Kiritimatiellia bacterium]